MFEEFCKENGWDVIADPVTQAARRRTWHRRLAVELSRPLPPYGRKLDGTITKTWRDDLAYEHRTEWYRQRIRLILPRQITILKPMAFARN